METFADYRLELVFRQTLQRSSDALWLADRASNKGDFENAKYFAVKWIEWQSLAIGLASR